MAAVACMIPRRLSVEIRRKRGWLRSVPGEVIPSDRLVIARGMRDLTEVLISNIAFEEAEMLFSLGFTFEEAR